MKRIHLMTAAMMLLAVWILPGCSDSPLGGSTDSDLLDRTQVVDLDDPYGGFNFGDESPMFGDEFLMENYGADAVTDVYDVMASDPIVADLERQPRSRTFLMITWGNLERDTTITEWTDWSGGLSVDNGVAVVKRLIRWDAHDQLLERTARDKIEWISKTGPHFDGIVVALHKTSERDSTRDSTAVDVVSDEPLSVTFRTGPLTVTINEEDLKDLHRVVVVDDAGNAVAFNTIEINPERCAAGFMAGQWKNVSHRPGGIFRGKWISHNGLHMGHLRGVYGTNRRGENVFFGKWINQGGQFRGLLKGHYGRNDEGPGGWFKGVWLNRSLHTRGGLRGGWQASDRIDGGGFFRGQWAEPCAIDNEGDGEGDGDKE